MFGERYTRRLGLGKYFVIQITSKSTHHFHSLEKYRVDVYLLNGESAARLFTVSLCLLITHTVH